jgi:DNA-directed RNA polymerase subunit L
MGELTVRHDFIDDETKIKIITETGDEITLEKNNPTHTFSDTVKKIFVTIKKGKVKCYIKCPSSSDLRFKSEKEAMVNMKIIGKSGSHYLEVPLPLTMWEFTFNIPKISGFPDPVTIGDNPP